MIERPERLIVWVGGVVFRLAFESKDARAAFVKDAERGEMWPHMAHDLSGNELWIRPSSVDVFKVVW